MIFLRVTLLCPGMSESRVGPKLSQIAPKGDISGSFYDQFSVPIGSASFHVHGVYSRKSKSGKKKTVMAIKDTYIMART